MLTERKKNQFLSVRIDASTRKNGRRLLNNTTRPLRLLMGNIRRLHCKKTFHTISKSENITNEPDPPQYYIMSTHNMQNYVYRLQNYITIDHTPDIKLRLNNEQNYICGKHSPLFDTNIDDLFVF